MIALNASSMVICVLRLGIRKPPPADSMVKANGGYVCVAVLMGGALDVAHCVACCCVCGHAEDAEAFVEGARLVAELHELLRRPLGEPLVGLGPLPEDVGLNLRDGPEATDRFSVYAGDVSRVRFRCGGRCHRNHFLSVSRDTGIPVARSRSSATCCQVRPFLRWYFTSSVRRSEEHTSELKSRFDF